MKKRRTILAIIILLLCFFPIYLSYGSFIPQIKTIELPLLTLPYTIVNSKTFAPQIFNYPCTQGNLDAYYNDFKNYNITRIPTLELSIKYSKSQEDALENLKKNQSGIQKIWQYNDKIMFNVNGMPQWLSDSSDDSTMPINEFWKVYHAHQPKDYNIWKSLIKKTISYLKSIQPEGKTVYYEIWNEPNGFWLDTSDDYMKLFSATYESIKAIDPNAKVGGPAVASYYGMVKPYKKPLIDELLTYCKNNNIYLDFISYHGFTFDFYRYFSEANKYIQDIEKKLGYVYYPEIFISEWNTAGDVRGTKSQCATMMEGYYAFWKLGITNHTWAAWEDFHYNLPNDYGLLSRAKIDKNKGAEKPVFWGFYYMDWLTKNTKGINVIDDILGFKCIVSKISDTEYRCILWNFICYPEIRARYYIMDNIPYEELMKDYKDNETIIKYIKLGKSINGKRDKEFKTANLLYKEDLIHQDTKYDYQFKIPDRNITEVKDLISIRIKKTTKNCSFQRNNINMQIQNNEVVVFTIILE
jgi:hypothetical protein